jgi:hypothetical protein
VEAAARAVDLSRLPLLRVRRLARRRVVVLPYIERSKEWLQSQAKFALGTSVKLYVKLSQSHYMNFVMSTGAVKEGREARLTANGSSL